MSRKHYIALAKILKAQRESLGNVSTGGDRYNALSALNTAVKAIASELKSDNSLFDRSRYRSARDFTHVRTLTRQETPW